MIYLYSTGCPKCVVLENKLKAKKVNYTKIMDINELAKKGFYSIPVLVVENNVFNFEEAVKWVNNIGVNE